MNFGKRPLWIECGQPLLAAFVSIAFLWTLVLAVSPATHLSIHSDAGSADHHCVVTLVASGSYEHAAQVPQVATPVPAQASATIVILTPQFVESAFLGARVFEHAPPSNS